MMIGDSMFRRYNFDNNMDGFYIAPAFMDKLIVHISKNFMTLPNIKVTQTKICFLQVNFSRINLNLDLKFLFLF